jgi:hypothetical protein
MIDIMRVTIDVLDLDFVRLQNCRRSRLPLSENPLVIPVFGDGSVIPGECLGCEEYIGKGLRGIFGRRYVEFPVIKLQEKYYCGDLSCDENLSRPLVD